MTKNNPTPQTRQDNVDELKRQIAEQAAEIASLQQHIKASGDPVTKLWPGIHHRLSMEELEAILVKSEEVQQLITLNTDELINLTPIERRRLMGAGMRRYGFIDKLSDVITNTKYESNEIKHCLRLLEMVRNLSVILETALRTNNDILLTLGNDAYRMALIIYRQIQIDSREGDAIAQTLFEILRKFFRPMGKRTSEEPTEAEVERDIKALLHGRKDGEIIVKNERDRIIKGKRTVVDETHKERAGFKETESGEING